MDGDLFGVAPDSTGGAAVGSYSDEPPPSQETTDGLDSSLPQQSESPKQQPTENLLDLAAQTTASQEPLVDLFGDSQLSPNPTTNATLQQQTQAAQPLDLFASPMPSANTPTPSQTTTVDLFAPVVSPAPMAATTPTVSNPVVVDDPFAAFIQPQVTPTPQENLQQPAQSDPFSALSGNLSIPAPPKPNIISSTTTTNPTNTTESVSHNPVSMDTQKMTSATATESPPHESETTQIAKPVVQIEEEKKDQESAMVHVDLTKEEKVVSVVDESSQTTIPIENGANKEEVSAREDSTANIATEESNSNSATSETTKSQSTSADVAVNNDVVEDEDEAHALDLVENVAQETAPTPPSASIPSEAPIAPSTTAIKQQPQQQMPQQQSQTQKQDSAPKLLPTLPKVSKVTEKKAPAVANRFAGFKSMAGNIAAKSAERVAKVKDQIKEEGESNRFSGFKNMAESMAQKGAERVAKVKDQIQKDEVEKQRFAGFKNMAESMAAKGAERVAKVKDQIQKEDVNGQNVKRLSGFNASNLFAKGNQAIENLSRSKHGQSLSRSRHGPLSRSKHGPKTVAAAPSTLSSSTSTIAKNNPKPAQATATATVAKSPQSDTSTPPSATPLPKTTSAPVATDAQRLVSETTADEGSVDSAPEPKKSQTNGVLISSTETTSITNDSKESISATASQDNGAKESESIPLSPKDNTAPKIPPSKDNFVEAKTQESASDSISEKNEVKSEKHNDVSKSVASQPSGSDPIPSKPKIETTVPDKPLEASKESPKDQIAPKTKESTPSKEILNQIETLKKELQAAQSKIKEFQKREKEGNEAEESLMMELHANLQKEMTRRAEAEDKARVAIKKSKRIEEEYTTFKTQSMSNFSDTTTSMESLKKEKDAMEKELVEIREERDEQARKEMALTTRLNDFQKKEAVKANAAEHYGEKVDLLQVAVNEYESQVETLTAERDELKVELGEWKEYTEKRTGQLEKALNDEKKLNDERKKKMKGFVEAKTDEVRAAKADYISLQTELDQTSHSLTELNQRYKQLHAQWVQSQTRNRELQRDAMKMKKDSEKMHKVGGSLEARLSRSAQQSEDHKNKRIEARNELMSVLGQLEAERTVNSRLQESIKMTFTPKALSQQQTIQEALDDFDAALQKLSIRMGRPLPPTFSSFDSSAFGDTPSADGGIETDNGDATDSSKSSSLSEINSNRALQKLENETQRVTDKIVKFSASVEQMHSLLDGGGTKSCVDIFSQILKSGNPPALAASSGQRYGQITRNVP